MNPEDIGWSVLGAIIVVLVLDILWPFLPSSGPFSQLTGALEAVSNLAIPAMVIGVPAVAYYLLSEI